jgi:hypothetical protein
MFFLISLLFFFFNVWISQNKLQFFSEPTILTYPIVFKWVKTRFQFFYELDDEQPTILIYLINIFYVLQAKQVVFLPRANNHCFIRARVLWKKKKDMPLCPWVAILFALKFDSLSVTVDQNSDPARKERLFFSSPPSPFLSKLFLMYRSSIITCHSFDWHWVIKTHCPPFQERSRGRDMICFDSRHSWVGSWGKLPFFELGILRQKKFSTQ